LYKPFSELNRFIQILVADDEPKLREQWCWSLQQEGYSTCEAASTDEVISKLDEVHIILLDYYIPGSPTGPELIKKINEARKEKLDILVITGQATRRQKLGCIHAGATAYFVKGRGLDFDDVLAWIRQITYRIWLEGILNAMPDEILLMGRDSTIIWANEAKKNSFYNPQQPDNDIIGKPYLGTVELAERHDPDDLRFALGCPSKYVMDKVESIRTEWKYLHPVEKQYRWIELSVAPIKDSRGEVIAAAEVGRDVTLKKEMHDHLALVRAQQNWENRLNLFLKGFEKLGALRSRLYFINNSKKRFRLVTTCGMERTDASYFNISQDPPTQILQKMHVPMLIEIDTKNRDRDLEPDKTVVYLWHEGANKCRRSLKKFKQWLELPLLAPDEEHPGKWFLFGKVSVDKAVTGQSFSTYDIQLMVEYAKLGSDCINNARRHEELELHHNMHDAFLQSEQEIFTIRDDKTTLFQKAVKRACETMGTRICSIFELDVTDQKLHRAHSFGIDIHGKAIDPGQFPDETYLKDDGLTGSVFADWLESNKSRLVQVFNNLREQNKLRQDIVKQYENLIGEPLTNAIYASLGPPDQPFGLLRAANKITEDEYGDRKFRKRDEEMFEALAAQITLAISNFQLFENYRQAQKDKENYLQILTHQLRAPISNMLHITDNIMQDNFPKEAIDVSLKEIQELARYFANIVQNFETVVQGANFYNLDLKPIKLVKNIRRCINILSLQGVTEIANIIDDLPEVKGDENRLDQVFINLLDNARKYSTEPRMPICIDGGYDEDMVFISIINEGPAIDPNSMKRILKFGERLEEAKAISKTGSGIGLTATSIILEQLNGKLDITSNPIIEDRAKNVFKIMLSKWG